MSRKRFRVSLTAEEVGFVADGLGNSIGLHAPQEGDSDAEYEECLRIQAQLEHLEARFRALLGPEPVPHDVDRII